MSTELFVPIALEAIKTSRQLIKVLPNKASLKLATELAENRRSAPSKLSELTNDELIQTKLSTNVAGKLGIPFGSTEGSFSRSIFIQEHAKYVDIPNGKGNVRWGVAIRWISNIKVIDVKANISSLPVISASAELGHVEASSKFQVIGMSSKKITELMPSNVALSIESYAEMKRALQEIKAEIWSKNTTIAPTILSVYSSITDNVDNKYLEPLAASWALSKIQEGRTLNYALQQDPIRTSDTQSTIESVYMDVVESTDRNIKPSEKAKRKTRSFLHGMTIK